MPKFTLLFDKKNSGQTPDYLTDDFYQGVLELLIYGVIFGSAVATVLFLLMCFFGDAEKKMSRLGWAVFFAFICFVFLGYTFWVIWAKPGSHL